MRKRKPPLHENAHLCLQWDDIVEKGYLHSAWQGLKNMAAVNSVFTSRKPIQMAGRSFTSLPNDLNSFFTRFEKDNSTQLESSSPHSDLMTLS